MRLITLVSVVLAVSASALAGVASERNFRNNAGGNRKRQTNNGTSDPQTSLTLDSGVICTNCEQNGMANATTGQTPSLTSDNNFINFCLSMNVNLPLTNGQQIKSGSCNPIPMGVLAPSTNMPSSKFVTPENLGAVKAHTTFEIKMAVKHLQMGNFTNPDTNYYGAPQQLNSGNDIIGHAHFVIEPLSSITSTVPSDPTKFAFFSAVNTPADDQGNVSLNVTNGLPAGVYKLSSINTSANHAPVLVAVAQHGTPDDQIYFFVTADGNRPSTIVPNSSTEPQINLRLLYVLSFILSIFIVNFS